VSKIRLHINLKGAVQGVGFRPFIFRLAEKFNLYGFICNSSSGVTIEAEGENNNLKEFLPAITKEKPTLAVITSLEYLFLDAIGYKDFTIKTSEKTDNVSTLILPDISICTDCTRELFDPADRRYLYPFINCTNCGPRFSIIENLPYDRKNTSMKKFEMCDECSKEYNDPLNRRFHAQPIACHKCGPQLQLWDQNGKITAEKHYALIQASEEIKNGKIIALKGIGGFQLIADAASDGAVKRLRLRKHRDEKPFALMFPSLEKIKEVCEFTSIEERVLASPECPIVILHRINSKNNLISALAAPDNPNLGVMLPYSPLHHLLMHELNFPVIATSGNLSEEPICTDEYEALKRLKGIPDYFLIHNRPIVRHVDDSILRVAANREMVLRRARGFAPLPVSVPEAGEDDETLIAFGGHLKNTIAVKKKENIFISQHIGDLSTAESDKAFKNAVKDFRNLYELKPDKVLCDLHPDYSSTKYAEKSAYRVEYIQHHTAHISACRIENQVRGESLGVCWDGTGYGLDDSVWGGEFFFSDEFTTRHIGQFRKFPLPGGETAVKESRRSALGVIYELSKGNSLNKYRDIFLKIFLPAELDLLLKMLDKGINSPLTSSAGRLFDAVSSMLMLKQYSSFEGQAAMQLEYAADKYTKEHYPFDIYDREISVIDWQTAFEALIDDIRKGTASSVISSKFHNTLVEIIYLMSEKFNLQKVILSGGCFQNVVLLERTIERLESKLIKVYWHQRVPPNDGGISIGQIAEYLRRKKPAADSKYEITYVEPNARISDTNLK
jgi:hydrogenase maturation protein HypF